MSEIDDEIAIEVHGLFKEFILPQSKTTSLKQAALNIVRENKVTTQKVLSDISFTVNKGDFFGIVGRNGSGKSTLLKLLSGIYTPGGGIININGSLVPFIELGVGFNPELSGRDNVYLNGALLGYTHKQMDEMYEEIVDFAEIGPFMDQKLKNYSSGMQVRLAFSIAIRAKADILILDEVLAVGDEAFQRKCNDYFNKIRNDKDQTVILVTHSMDAVKKYCNKAILLKDGEIVAQGDPIDIANDYSLENISVTQTDDDESEVTTTANTGVEAIKIKLLSDRSLNENDEIKFEMTYKVTKNINTVPAISITDMDRNVWLQNDNMWDSIVKGSGEHKIRYACKLPRQINDCALKIEASVWSDDEEILGFVTDKNTPKIVIRRSDIKGKRIEGIASGILSVKGEWETIK